MKEKSYLHIWTIVAPVLAWAGYAGFQFFDHFLYSLLVGLLLIGSVLAAVHHAEVMAFKLGEPFGTLLLAIAITIIEVALIVSLMLTGGELETTTLARDTVLAAVMIILTGIIGICILKGAAKYKEQSFKLQGVSVALITLTAILVFSLILPNYTTSKVGPAYNNLQIGFIAVLCLTLYIAFILVQAIRHRPFFLAPETTATREILPPKPSARVTSISMVLLLLCLGIVVLLAKSLAPQIEHAVFSMGAPKSIVGVIIAAIVLLPEGLAAYRAAAKNRLQTSLNLSFGSALASIGLTIPAVALVSMVTGMPITLGIDNKAIVLLLLALFTIVVSLATGRTNILQGIVLITIFLLYIFITLVP